jgi:glutaminyl-tRNA synthetase
MVADLSLLEFCVREDLNKKALRRMVVFEPIKVVITNYTNEEEILEIDDNPTDDKNDVRKVPFSKELYIEQEDFMENPPKKFFRLFPGGMVRLKGAYIIKCDEIIKDDAGNITELHCSYIPESRSGQDTSEIKVKGTIHWVSISHAQSAELRLYDRLFKVEDPQSEQGDFKDYINPDSLQIIKAFLEPSLKDAEPNIPYQFIRKGYFCLDKNSSKDNLVFNRTVTLKEAPTKSFPKG